MGLTGQTLADYAAGKKGTPYFYGSKMAALTESFMQQMHNSYPNTVTENYMQKARSKGQVGKVCVDCSGLISAYTGKVLGSAQLYQQAYTRLAMSTYKSWANGVVVWRSGHVGVFFEENGGFYVAEAKGIDYGTVISAFDPGKWSYGLTFLWLDYSYTKNVVNEATWKGTNPYPVPTVTVSMGSKGDAVKWVQWELVEAGYAIDIDGDCGPKTDEAIRAFQASCNLAVDGKVGPDTRKYFLENVQGEVASVPNMTEEIYGIIIGDWVNVRKGPGKEYASIGTVNKGDRVRVWKESAGWCMVDKDKWISKEYVSIEGSEVSAPAASPAPEQTEQEVYAVVTGNGVRVRIGPGTNYPEIYSVDAGHSVRIWDEKDGWYMVDNGKWISAKYVQRKA